MKSLATGLHRGLLLSIDNLKLKKFDDREFTSNILKIIQITGMHPLSAVAVEEHTKILEQLHLISALEDFSFHDLAKSAIDSICTLNKRSDVDQNETTDPMLEDVFIKMSSFQDISITQNAQSNFRPSTDSHGAGVILRSSLVYSGWKFPPFIVTESDEKILFELMVRLNFSGPTFIYPCCDRFTSR
jgi:hypothetical protein